MIADETVANLIVASPALAAIAIVHNAQAHLIEHWDEIAKAFGGGPTQGNSSTSAE